MSYLAMREDRGESFRLKGKRERERRTKHVSSPFARERRIKWIKSDREKRDRPRVRGRCRRIRVATLGRGEGDCLGPPVEQLLSGPLSPNGPSP